MNQILVSEKLYITPELKKKKRMYKIDFFISVFLVCILFSYYIYAEYDKNKSEEESQEVLASLTFEDNVVDDTTIKFSDSSTVVILNSEDPFEVIYSEPVEETETHENEVIPRNTRVTESGQVYWTIAKIEIPKIEFPGFTKIMSNGMNVGVNVGTEKEQKASDTEQQTNLENDESFEISEIYEEENPDGIIDKLFHTATDETKVTEEKENEHKVDPDEFALYKKYLS